MKKLNSLLLIAFIFFAGCSNNSNQGESTTEESTSGHQPPEAQTTENHQTLPTSLNEAIELTKNDMGNFDGNQIPAGTMRFAAYSTRTMNWSELKQVNSTKYALVMKDSHSEKGKSLCFGGTIVQISVTHLSDDLSLAEGVMVDDQYRPYSYVAVKSTGELVAHNRAKFCGIVTGVQNYENNGGGHSQAVHIIGMFDLPENKIPT